MTVNKGLGRSFASLIPTDLVDEEFDPTSLEGMQRAAEKRKSKEKTKRTGTYDDDGYLIWTVPWSLNLSYTMRYQYKNFNREKREFDRGIVHSATFSGTFQPTKGWNFSFTSSCSSIVGSTPMGMRVPGESSIPSESMPTCACRR